MTAFGRAEKITSSGRFVLEIHSVNRKTLDIALYIPKDLIRFDIDLRQMIGEVVQRGSVTLRLSVTLDQNSTHLFSTYRERLKPLKEGWSKIAESLGLDPKEEINLPFLLRQLEATASPDLYPDDEEIKTILKELATEALSLFSERRKQEGQSLLEDMEARLKAIEKDVLKIKNKAQDAVKKYREKLLERIKEVSTGEECDERILREVALYAEKVDITEEIIRLETHLKQFSKELHTSQKSIGRTLDFMIQEMHREINTIASKSADIEISSLTITIKSELEKIREQVQNIE